jgi:hypothetical protein
MTKQPIQFIYSNNELCGSRLISYATKEPWQIRRDVPSHFSILVWEWVIIESTMLYGIEPKLFAKFKDHNKIIAAFAPKEDQKSATAIAKASAEKNRDAKYDFAAALYLGVHELMNLWFKTPIPAKNRFDNSKEFFCNEIYRDLYGGDVSMKHPNALMQEMMKDERLLRLA